MATTMGSWITRPCRSDESIQQPDQQQQSGSGHHDNRPLLTIVTEQQTMEAQHQEHEEQEAQDTVCSFRKHSTEDDDEDEDEDIWPPLPKGAEYIIRQIAAEHILMQLLDNKQKVPETVPFRAVRILVQQFPGICHRRYEFTWDDGSTRVLFPLSMICCLKPSLETVQTVFGANPSAVREMEPTRGSLPLHFLSAFEASLNVVQFIYRQNPAAISTPRKDSVYPIHLATVYYRGDPSVINFLLDEYPAGATKLCGDSDWSALTSAASGGVGDLQVLQRLYELHPGSPTARDSYLQTPLHLACESRRDEIGTVISFLIEKAPEALFLEDMNGLTPLFLAAIHQPPHVIRTILDLAPGVATVNPNRGTILHWAATHNTTAVIDFLARRFPDMLLAQTLDDDRDTPLSCACFNGAPMENIRALIRHGPRALLLTNASGQTLVEAAEEFPVDEELLFLLKVETELHAPPTETTSWH